MQGPGQPRFLLPAGNKLVQRWLAAPMATYGRPCPCTMGVSGAALAGFRWATR